ncbi:GH24211 [Drosophila grimshawi]|uniref:GH24211 n=1 Tax=Drosophila grimshawi TaxID=7222 RepID=B4JN39_DROGR|nr:GH24211 [Drosophila grimshawi]
MDMENPDIVKNAPNNKEKSILQPLHQQPPGKGAIEKKARNMAADSKALANSVSVKEMDDCVADASTTCWHFACLPQIFEKRYSSRRVAARNWMCQSCSNASRAGRKKRPIADQTAAKANQMMTKSGDIDCTPATKIVEPFAASDQNKQLADVHVTDVVDSTEDKENVPIQQLMLEPNTFAMPVSKQAPLKTWSVEQVSNLIDQISPGHGSLFKDHNINGTALMSLTIDKILDEWDLKLGAALTLYEKICEKIFELQTTAKSSDDDDGDDKELFILEL